MSLKAVCSRCGNAVLKTRFRSVKCWDCGKLHRVCRECALELYEQIEEGDLGLEEMEEDEYCDSLSDDEREGDVEERGTQPTSIALPGIDRQGALM